MAYCTLTDVPSWFTCLQVGGIPFTEVTTLVVFLVFFMVLKAYPTREAFAASAFVTALIAMAFLGAGLINPTVTIVWVIVLAIAAVMLFAQNNQ